MRQITIQTTDVRLARAMAREWSIPGVTIRPRVSNIRTRALGIPEVLTLIAGAATVEAVKALLDLIDHHLQGRRDQETRVDGEAVPEDPEERRRFAERLLQGDAQRQSPQSAHEQPGGKPPRVANDNE